MPDSGHLRWIGIPNQMTNPDRSHRRPVSPCLPTRALACAAGAAFLASAAGLAWAEPTAETIRIGVSESGLPIEAVVLGGTGPDGLGRLRDDRPALLIVAGLQGHHEIGPRAARAMIDRLLGEHAGLLENRTVYIIPEANPEGADRWANRNMPRAETGRAPQVGDADRDGRTGEDPANDLNADGLITMMRVPAPNARYGIGATHIIDPDDARLMREPKAADGESATHALLIEGTDADGDGSFNEDGWGGSGGGGVDLDKHFPTHWPEHTDGAGLYPLARSEARALVEWVQSRSNIVAVLVYGPHDTLATVPPAGKYGPVGRVPTGIEEGDKAYYEKVTELFKETTGITKAGDSPDRAGSFLQWAYSDLGVFAFGTPVWVRPDLVKSDTKKDEPASDKADAPAAEPADPMVAEARALTEMGVSPELVAFITMAPEERAAEMASFESRSQEEQMAMMAAVQAAPESVRLRVMALAQGNPDPGPMAAKADGPAPDGARPARSRAGGKKGDSADAKWLEWIDAQDDVAGFVEWTPFDHPQLGPVEIGGFVPGVRVNPPEELVPALIDQQAAFVAGLLERLPSVEIDPPSVERVGAGLWRISLTARNTGLLPTVASIGVKSRRLHGLVFAFDPDQSVPKDRLVSGERVVRFSTLEGSGATAEASWLVAAEDGSQIRIAVRTPRFGNRGFDVRLTEQRPGADAGQGGAR